ncbi:hypothetical protein BREVNS_1058 [Brevinematales bacterium NS]|nr:amidohydrolase family protein [Brevinematales bacterium]QJR21808.1 hypothetical protein BREVNS_1058 [Brevinematales bacterium NS]
MIDSHMHLSLGKVYNTFDEAALLEKMDTIGIQYGIVSLIDVMEYGHQHQNEPLATFSEYEGLKVLLEMISSNRLFPLAWVRPRDRKKDAFFHYLEEKKEKVYGFKFHPFHSRLPLNHDLWQMYFEMAERFHWPVVIHTAIDEFSRVELVSRWAERYEVPIVLVHMGLYTDHQEAVTMMLRYPHVYGDTTWVKEENLWPILDRCGPEKILFGSDALVGGENTYGFYQPLFEKLSNFPREADWLLKRNAEKIFRLKEDKNEEG